MNPNIPNDKVLKKYNDLPEDIKDALFADDVTKNILEIGKSHGLMIDKIGELSDETGLVMLGITPTADFIKNLSDRLGVDKEKAKAIAEDINQKVFQQIRASLRKIHGLPGETPEKIVINKPEPTGVRAGEPGPVGEIPKSPIEPRPGEIKNSSPIFAKKIVPIDELLDKIDSGESIIKEKAKIENVPPPSPMGGIRTMFNDVKSAITGGVKKEDIIVAEEEPQKTEAPKKEPPKQEPQKPAALPKLTLSTFTAPATPSVPSAPTTPTIKNEPPVNLPVSKEGPVKKSEAELTPDEIKAAVEKALGGKITNQTPPPEAPAMPKPTPPPPPSPKATEGTAPPPKPPSPPPTPAPPTPRTGNDPYREPIE